jgi:hypothetical protein
MGVVEIILSMSYDGFITGPGHRAEQPRSARVAALSRAPAVDTR